MIKDEEVLLMVLLSEAQVAIEAVVAVVPMVRMVVGMLLLKMVAVEVRAVEMEAV